MEAAAGPKEVGLLNRCVVGHFDKEIQEKPMLADIRKWTSTNWRAFFKVNIFKMLGQLLKLFDNFA